jgi:hypothetical protein
MFGMICAWAAADRICGGYVSKIPDGFLIPGQVRETPHPQARCRRFDRAGDTIAELDRKHPIIQNAVPGI